MKAHWEEVYAEHDPDDVSWYQSVPDRSLEWIESALEGHRDARIIDVGSGTSTLVDRLLERGFRNLAVLDVSARALEQVRHRLGELSCSVEWHPIDLLDFSPTSRFDLWHDRAVLHFLGKPSEQRRYAEILRSSLTREGYALIATFAVGGPTSCSGLDVTQYDADRLLQLLGDEFCLVRTEEEEHHTPNGRIQLFQYSLLLRHTLAQ